MLKTRDIHLRDPFVLTVPDEGRYYLYGTHLWDGKNEPDLGFNCYTSADLENWEGPFPIFRPPDGFWGCYNFWAPEVHLYRGRYYLFASFKARDTCRATQIFSADSPGGPFRLHSSGPVTPAGWESLDGTLYLERHGREERPWMVFCHEWVQTGDGEICAVRLSKDLKRPLGQPKLLFRASAAPWVRPLTAKWEGQKRTGFVTDGPFLYHDGGTELRMLWSSFSSSGYSLSVAHSASGDLEGPWIQDEEPMYQRDAGHAMRFHTLDGRPMLSLHEPNRWPCERPVFIPMEELGQANPLNPPDQ